MRFSPLWTCLFARPQGRAFLGVTMDGWTVEQWKEILGFLVPLLFGQVTLLVVQIIHAKQAKRDRALAKQDRVGAGEDRVMARRDRNSAQQDRDERGEHS